MSELEELQQNIEHFLLSDPALQYVSITSIRPRSAGSAAQIQTKISEALKGMLKRNGKAGLAAIVTMPEVGEAESQLPGVSGMLQVKIQVIENVMINMGTSGTEMSCEDAALLIAGLLQHRSFDGIRALMARGQLLVPVPDELVKGNVTYDVLLSVPFGQAAPTLVATPTISEAAGTVTMSCATSGAAIYYTLDGSFPGSGNPTAVLYSAPVVFTPGTYAVRVAGHKTGLSASRELRGSIVVS